MEQEITAIQPQLTQHFAKLINENRLAHAYLLSGASGTGKLSLAVWIAQEFSVISGMRMERRV